MIKVYGMSTCPDCSYIEEQIKGNDKYQMIDIGQHVRNLKAFMKIRDNSPVFNAAREMGSIGIPCFVLEDGTITLEPEDAGLQSRPIQTGAVCNLDGSGC